MHLVGSCYTDISRSTVNKTFIICQLQFRDFLREHSFISRKTWSSSGHRIQSNLLRQVFISFCVTKPSLVPWRWGWSQSLKRSTNFTPELGYLPEKTLLNFFLINSNTGRQSTDDDVIYENSFFTFFVPYMFIQSYALCYIPLATYINSHMFRYQSVKHVGDDICLKWCTTECKYRSIYWLTKRVCYPT